MPTPSIRSAAEWNRSDTSGSAPIGASASSHSRSSCISLGWRRSRSRACPAPRTTASVDILHMRDVPVSYIGAGSIHSRVLASRSRPKLPRCLSSFIITKSIRSVIAMDRSTSMPIDQHMDW